MRGATPTLDYITRTFVREPEWIMAARDQGEALVPGMQISPYEGHVLAWLVKLSGAQHILEIGTFMGVSTLWMASALPAGGTLTSLEFRREHAALARAHVAQSPHAHQVTIVEGDGLAWLRAQHAAPRFDMMFIDAEKRAYPDYLEEGLRLLTPRGWVVGDNTLLFGALSGDTPDAASKEAVAAMQRFNTTLADASQFTSVLLPTPEGMTVARRNY